MLKKNRWTWIFLAFVVVLGGFAAWDLQSDQAREEKKSEAALLVPFQADQVQSLSILSKNQKIILDKSIDGWKMLSPWEDWADSVAADEFLEAVTKQKSLSVILNPKKDLAVYGLTEPEGQITFTHQNKNTITYEVGSERTIELNSYVRKKGSPEILVAPPEWASWLKKSAGEFRDRRLLRGRMAAITEVEVKNPKGDLKFVKADNVWALANQPAEHLDQARIREMLNQITLTKGTEIVAEKNISSEQKTKYGINTSDVHLKVKNGDKIWNADFAKNKDKSVYVLTSEPHFLMRLEENFFDRLKNLNPLSFKDRTELFAIQSEVVAAVELQTALKKQDLKLKASGWVFNSVKGDQPFDTEKMIVFLASLKKMSLVDFAEKKDSNIKKFKGSNKINLKDEQGALVFQLVWDEFQKVKFDGKEKSVALARTRAGPDLFYLEQNEIEKLKLNEMIIP